MKKILLIISLLTSIVSSYSQQIRQEVVEAEGDVLSAILDTYTGHEVLVNTPTKVVILVKKLVNGYGAVYRHTYDIKKDRFRYTVSMKTLVDGVVQEVLNTYTGTEEEYKKTMIDTWISMGYSEKKAEKWYVKYGDYESIMAQADAAMSVLNNELDSYRDSVINILSSNDDW